MFAHQELERTVRHMRDRFAAISAQISRALSQLERSIDRAPPEVRASISASAYEIVQLQANWRAQLERLPAEPGQRMRVMQDLLQAQFEALQRLSGMIEFNAASMQRPQYHEPYPAAGNHAGSYWPQPGYPPPGYPGAGYGYQPDPHQQAWAHQQYGQQMPRPQGASHGQRVSTVFNESGQGAPRRGKRAPRESSGAVSFAASHPIALMTLLIGALAFGHVAYSRVMEPRAASSAAPAGEQAPEGATRTARLPAEEPPSGPPMGEAREAPPARAPMVVMPPPAAAPLPEEPRYVAVLFTHKEQAVASRAYGELRRQYASVLARRQGEIQPVDLGSKGVWHRLVVLPAGAREDADALCERLKIAGNDRCWVKAY